MFGFLTKKTSNEPTLRFRIQGMHCSSCAMNIDNALEEADGIKKSTTNYARQETVIQYDPTKISAPDCIKLIKGIGYEAVLLETQ